MKRTVLSVLIGLAVFCICFVGVWSIVRVFAQNAPALEVAVAGLACAISFAITRYVVRDLMQQRGK